MLQINNARAMKIRQIIICILILIMAGYRAEAQKASVSTNIVEWVYLGTINAEAGVSISQHLSIAAGARYNPWKYQTPKGFDMYDQKTSIYTGVRYWPWYIFSGWWIEADLQYASFSRTGIWRPALEEGQSLGACLSFGYTIMLHQNLNLEFGAGLWGGRHLKYNLYECPKCMMLRDSGPRGFIAADKLSVSIMYIF